jgi:hypothetical protein
MHFYIGLPIGEMKYNIIEGGFEMVSTKKLVYFVIGLVLVLGIFMAAPAAPVSAEDPDPGGDPSGDGIDPVYIEGNPSCATLNANNTGFPNVTSDFGFKISEGPNGTFPFINVTNVSSLTGGALPDPYNWVTISNSDGVLFDWLASLGIDAVIVKGGPNSDAFVYVPEDTADKRLHPPVNPNSPTGDYYSISHIEFCYDYEFSAVKTANTSYTRTYSWTIDKSVDPASHTGFAGDSFTSDYDIVVDQSYVDSDFAVYGTITVTNPSPFTAGFSVADSVGGTPVSVTCPTYSLAPFASTTCTYSTGLAAKTNGTNTATVTSLTAGIGGATATADYAFGDPTSIVGYPTVNVSDTFPYPGGTPEALGSASSDTTFDNDQDFACPTDTTLYTDGYYSYQKVNRAQIVETEQFDEATVTVHCYLPQVTKDAAASYDETHTWILEKTVNPLYQEGYPGDVLPWTWKVDVSETFADSNFAVSGSISVYNPHPTLPLVVDVSDQLNDGTAAAVDCDPVTEGYQTSLTVAALGTGVCSYTAAPTGRTATLNTAMATRNTVQFTGTAAVTFVKDVIHGTALITDTQIGLNQTLTAGAGPWQFTAPDSHTCSMDSDMYGPDGYYEGQESNTAYLTPSGGTQQSDGALTEYMCEGGYVDLLKMTDGLVDPTMTWSFALYNGPDGFGSTALGSGSTFGDADGIIDFGMPILNPEETYTICELGVPAGWSSLWQVGGSTVVPYNPQADNPVPEDLGNRCVDFGFGTAIPVTVRTTLHFQVDNRAPGGDPRTPGYWKNWNTCSGGRQALTAAANGGWENGFWLLDDVLNPAVGGGIVWDDIKVDTFAPVNIDRCAYAVDILDQRVVKNIDIVGDGKKLASDPLRTLAMHLLAAQLNFGAGACTTPEVLDAALQAETLLDKYNFDGKKLTAYAPTKADKALALSLAGYLDNYNNGMYCGSTIP